MVLRTWDRSGRARGPQPAIGCHFLPLSPTEAQELISDIFSSFLTSAGLRSHGRRSVPSCRSSPGVLVGDAGARARVDPGRYVVFIGISSGWFGVAKPAVGWLRSRGRMGLRSAEKSGGIV